MTFQINRTSYCLNKDNLPCAGATLALDRTSMHARNIYTIEINTLEELLLLKEQVEEEIIIRDAYECKEIAPLEIEIYDDYRE